MLFNPVNLPYWILLGIGIALFLLVILSGGGDDELDLDADADLEIDANPLDLDTDAEFSLSQVAGWLGFGKAPLILLLATDLSLWGLVGWILTVALGEALGGVPNAFWAGVIFVIALAAALVLGSLIARPIGKALAAFGEDVSSDRLIGCVGTVSSAALHKQAIGRIGQVNVLDSAKNLVIINAVLPDWATASPRLGEKVLLIDRRSHYYLVVAKDSPDQDRWLANLPQTDQN